MSTDTAPVLFSAIILGPSTVALHIKEPSKGVNE